MANTYIFDIIINKLELGQEFSLVILLEIDKGLKINFYNIVLLLFLVICPRINGSWESPFDDKEIIEQ